MRMVIEEVSREEVWRMRQLHSQWSWAVMTMTLDDDDDGIGGWEA